MCPPVLMHAPVYLQLSHTLENIYTTELLKAMPTNVLYTENDLIWPHKPLFETWIFPTVKSLTGVLFYLHELHLLVQRPVEMTDSLLFITSPHYQVVPLQVIQ